MNVPQIIDANINRISEGLRVIEEYTRFILKDKQLTDTLSHLRKQCNSHQPQTPQHLMIRDTQQDVRALDPPKKRESLRDCLIANFKRAQEACRVLEEYTSAPLFNNIRYQLYELEKTICLPLYKKQFQNGIYLISDQVEICKKGLDWGVALVQLRDKYATKEEIYNKAKEISAYAKDKDTPFLVNDFLDIMQLVDADGLHTGQDDLPLTDIKELIGPHKICGRTTHTPEQGKEAQEQGADYVSIGPIYKTPSKPDREPIGFFYLEKAAQTLSIPYVAIGGINTTTIDTILPYQPPLIGLIRDYNAVPEMIEKIKKYRENSKVEKDKGKEKISRN